MIITIIKESKEEAKRLRQRCKMRGMSEGERPSLIFY